MSSSLVGVIGGIGPVEIIIVLVIVLLLFGAKRLPEVGRSLGQGMREFKQSVTGKDRDEDEDREPRRLETPAGEGGSAPTASAAEKRPAGAGEPRT
jgi:sec-independent protein translocase protein TatA